MSLNIPDFMPVLSGGPHKSPAEGACVMEYISFLAGEKWSDSPACTNPALAVTAQRINDHLADGERQALIPLIPRLMGTNDGDFADLERIIAGAAVEHATPLLSDVTLIGDYASRAKYMFSVGRLSTALMYATWSVSWSEMDKIAFLSHLIDAYDKAAGRTEAATVTEDDLRRCAELAGASK